MKTHKAFWVLNALALLLLLAMGFFLAPKLVQLGSRIIHPDAASFVRLTFVLTVVLYPVFCWTVSGFFNRPSSPAGRFTAIGLLGLLVPAWISFATTFQSWKFERFGEEPSILESLLDYELSALLIFAVAQLMMKAVTGFGVFKFLLKENKE